MTFDDWWKRYGWIGIDIYTDEEAIYELCHGAYEFGMETMLERQKKNE